MAQHGTLIRGSPTAGPADRILGSRSRLWTPGRSAPLGRRGSRLSLGFRAALCVKHEGPDRKAHAKLTVPSCPCESQIQAAKEGWGKGGHLLGGPPPSPSSSIQFPVLCILQLELNLCLSCSWTEVSCSLNSVSFWE